MNKLESLTFEVPRILVRAIVLAPGRVVPFYTEPLSRGASYLSDVPNGAECAIVGKALTDSELSARGHVISSLLRYSKERVEQRDGGLAGRIFRWALKLTDACKSGA